MKDLTESNVVHFNSYKSPSLPFVCLKEIQVLLSTPHSLSKQQVEKAIDVLYKLYSSVDSFSVRSAVVATIDQLDAIRGNYYGY